MITNENINYRPHKKSNRITIKKNSIKEILL